MGQSLNCCFNNPGETNYDQSLYKKLNEDKDSYEADRLSQVASNGNLEAMRMLLGENTFISINEKDSTGCTPLYRAAKGNHYDICKLLLELGASPNQLTHDKSAPLHEAAKHGNENLCNLLLKHKANTNVVTSATLMTPLHYAVQYNHLNVVRFLCENGADVNIHLKIHQLKFRSRSNTVNQDNLNNNSESLKQIDDFRSSSLPMNKTSSPLSSSTPYYTKSSLVNYDKNFSLRNMKDNNIELEKLKELEETTQNVNIMQPIIILACENGNAAIVKYLLENANALYKYEDENGNYDCIHDPITNEKGASVLMVACDSENFEVVNYLLNFYKAIEKISLSSNAKSKHLLKRTVNGKNKKYKNWNALHYTASKGNVDIARLLLKHKANIDSVDTDLRTPLHHASEKGHYEMVKFLIDSGASYDIRDNTSSNDDEESSEKGKTPLDLATSSLQYHKVAKAFRDAIRKREEVEGSNNIKKESNYGKHLNNRERKVSDGKEKANKKVVNRDDYIKYLQNNIINKQNPS